ncbi:S-layer homology domain-containing protein [Aedoeadaptatus coxii]|nr:S-layer homology domain-containing protein [Peptoniphilus coxii]
MKRHLALLLAFCMLLTSFPVRSVEANGAKEVPQGIVFDTSEGDLKIGFSGGKLSDEQSDWMHSITTIKINKQFYYKEGTTTGEGNYKFAFDERGGKIIIDNHVLALPENTIEIAAQGYTFYKGVIKNENIKKMADGLTITSIETGKSSKDPIGTYVGVRLSYKYDSDNGGALTYLLKNNVERVVIDGKTLNFIGSDNYPNLLWQDGVFRTWDKMKDATAIVENFGNNAAHEFKIIMKDGSEVVKTEEGYVDENNEPAPNEKLRQVNTGGMAAGLEIDGVGTPEKLGNALVLSSDTPKEEWYGKYFQNIRYILVDDNQGNDLRPGFSNFFVDAKKDTRDLTLFNGKLEFAMTGLKLLDNKAHKIEIGFKDGNTITYTQAGYVPPKDIKFDVKKYIEKEDKKQKPETGNENTLAKRFQIDHIGFSKNWKKEYDYSTPKIFFKNLPPKSDTAESTALEEAMKNASFQVNGGDKITNVQGWITRGMTECFEAYSDSKYGGPALGEALKQAGEDPHIVVTFSDGSVWDNKPSESGNETPAPETGKKDDYPIQNIIFKINGTSPQLELDFGSAQKAKEVDGEIKTIKINGKAYDKSTFGYSRVTDHYISNDEAIAKALYGKSEIKVDITFNDDTTATKTVTITPVEDPNAPKPQPETPKLVTKVDAATGVKAEYMSDVFEEGTELKVEKVDKAKFFETYKNAAKEIDKAGNFTAYKVSFVKNGVNQGTIKNVKLFFPLGDHNMGSVALYQAYAYEDDDDQLQTGADKVEPKVEGDFITYSTNTFTTYAITSDKMITKTDDAAKVSVEYPKGAFKEGTELKVVNVAGGQFVKDNAAVKSVAEKAKTVTAFDISFLLKNVKQQPNRKVEVTLPLGAHDKDSVKVYHFDKEGTAAPELVKDVKIQGDKIVFEADKFSYYFVTSGVKEEPGDTRKLNERFAIEAVKLETSSYGSKSLKIFFKNYPKQNEFDAQKALAKAIKEATFTINGGEPIKNVDGYCSYGTANAFDVISDGLQEAMEKAGENPHIKVVFSDRSEWENRKAGEAPAKTDNFGLTDKLPNGEYTIQFIASKEGETADLPMVSGIIGNRAKLVVENGKMMLSLRVGKMADQILDLGMKIDDQFKSGVKTTDGLKQGQAIYTCEVKDLDQIQKLAVLVKIMGGSADKIGQFDKYTKADLHFKAPIKKGFTGYDDPTDPEVQKKRNADNLTLKLLDAGVRDLDNDGKLSPEELSKATGHLDLSGEKIGKTPDISMLKDLGPGVTGIELSSNDITEIPAGLFDKMTGVTHINIYGNKLETLPKGIFDKNENLSTLWMSGNKLKDLDKDLLAKNKRIKEIDLSNNGIEKLPEGFVKNASRLAKFYASDNKLTSLDGVFADSYKQLAVINVNGNRLTSLPEVFGNYSRLEELRANNNKLKALPGAMDQLSRLVILDLENNEIESLPESLWLRMADNANQYATKFPNLIVKGNLLKDIPFDKIAEKASGQRVRFNKFDVSCNYLKSTLTDSELATIKKAGVTIKDTHDNYYQPQRSAFNAQVNYADGNVKVSQDLDLLQMFYWNIGDINDWKFFKNPDEYKAFVKNTIYKKYGIRTANDQLGIAQVLDKDGWDWKIQNIIEKIEGDKSSVVYNGYVKNKGHNDVESEIDPVDSLNPTIEAALDPGANYKLTRRVMLSKNNFETEFSYSVDFKTPANTPSQEDTKLKEAKDALRAAIAAAEAKLKDGKDYTDATKQEVNNQLAVANEALKANDAEAMNAAKAALEKAVKALKEKEVVPQEDAKLKEAKAALTKAIAAAEAKLKDGKDYTADSKKAVEGKVAAAKEALKGNNVEAMNAAKANLENAVKALKEKEVVPQEDAKLKEAKAALTKAIAAAEAKLKDGKDYTADSKKAVEEKLAAAKEALKGNDAEAMNTANAALEKAVKALEVKPAVSGEDTKLKEAKDALGAAIQEAKNKLNDGKKYTAETKSAVEKAIAKAEKVLAGKDKAAMNKAKGDVEKAAAGLKVETQKPAPQPQPTPQPQPKPTPQPQPSPKPSDDKKDVPRGSSSGWTSYRPNGNTQSTPAKPQESKPAEKPKATETKQNFTVHVPKEAFVKGYPDGTFKPNQQVVRSEIATMLARFVTVNKDMAKQLKDIRTTDWYFDSFKTLVDAGIISGYGDNNYRPHDGVTRAQAVTMIVKLKGLQPKSGGFKDVPGNAWYAGYAGAAREAGIVVGYNDGSFGGDRVVTRAEIIAMINRAFNIPKKESRKAFSDLPENHWAYEDIQKAAN